MTEGSRQTSNMYIHNVHVNQFPLTIRVYVYNKKRVHLYIFVEVNWLIVNIMLHEEVIDTGQQGHLRQGEYIHELFHCVPM